MVKIRLSELKVVENAFFRLDLEYSKPSLYPFIEKTFSEDKSFDEESSLKLKKLIHDTKNELAHNVLLNADMSSIHKSIRKKDLSFNEAYWIKQLPIIHTKIEKALGLNFTARPIKFSDSFPEGYENFKARGASSITVFEGFPNPGIYYLNQRVDALSTGIHIIHEQIHTCLSQNKGEKQLFIEWFEEGIAILFSILIYFELTKDMDTLKAYRTRSIVFSKAKPEWDFTKRYHEYMKIMSRIFLAGGKSMLTTLIHDYIQQKRGRIDALMDTLMDDSLAIKYMPKNMIENMIASFSSTIEPEQITPLEYIIVRDLTQPKSIDTLSKDVNAPLDVTKNAISRLLGKAICVVVKDNKIDVNWRKKDLFDKKLIKPIFPLN